MEIRRLVLTLALVVMAALSWAGSGTYDGWGRGQGSYQRGNAGGQSIDPMALFSTAGVPGGGWLHASAIAHKSNIYVVGADVSGAYMSEDGGDTWSLHNAGLSNDDETINHYVDEAVAVKNSYFEGIIIGTHGGIYQASTASGSLADWASMTPTSNSDYIAYTDRSWTLPLGWLTPIGFSSIDQVSENVLVASAGRYRWDQSITTSYFVESYPTGWVSGGPAGGPWSVWTYDFSDPSPAWAPLAVYRAGDFHVRQVDGAVLGVDTYVLCATSGNGPQLYATKTSSYVDLASKVWRDDLGTAFVPVWDAGKLGTGADIQATDSCALTEDGRAFIALRNRLSASSSTSGIYMCADVLDGASEWLWVGDSTVLPSSGKTIANTGYGDGNSGTLAEFAYVRLAEGAGAEDDTLFAVARSGREALLRAIVPNPAVPNTVAWEVLLHSDGAGAMQPLDTWLDNNVPYQYTGSGIFQPAINPNDSKHILMHPNAKLYDTEDGGLNWVNVAGEGYGDDTRFKSSGYDETCANAVAIGGDGTLYYMAGDVGIFKTQGTDWDWFEFGNPGDQQGEACISETPGDNWWNDVDFPNPEAGDAVVVTDFNEQNEDMLVVVGGDIIQRVGFNKIFAYYDKPGGLDLMEWTHISADVDSLDSYQFLWNTIETADYGRTIYIGFRQFDESFCAPGDPTAIRAGVKVFTYTPGADTWATTEISANDDWGLIEPFQSALVGDRLFLSFKFSGSNVGYVRYHDIGGAAGWITVYGGTGSEGNCQALTTDGSIIYMASRGGTGHSGGLLVCDDPLGNPDVWERLCNNDDTDILLPDIFPLGPILEDRYGANADYVTAQRMFQCGTIMIDPIDNQLIYFTLSGNENNLTQFGGLYHYNRRTDTVTRLYEDDDSSFVSADRGRMVYSDAFSPARVLYGTHCSGPRWFNYPGFGLETPVVQPLAIEQFASTAVFDSLGNVGLQITATTNNSASVQRFFWTDPADTVGANPPWSVPATNHSGRFDSGILMALATADSSGPTLNWTDDTEPTVEGYVVHMQVAVGDPWYTAAFVAPGVETWTHTQGTELLEPRRGEPTYRIYPFTTVGLDTTLGPVAVLEERFPNQAVRIYAKIHADDGVAVASSGVDSELFISYPSGGADYEASSAFVYVTGRTTANNVKISIYNGSTSGILATSDQVSITSGYPGWFEVSFPAPITLVPGDTYYISTIGDGYWYAGCDGAGYAGSFLTTGTFASPQALWNRDANGSGYGVPDLYVANAAGTLLIGNNTISGSNDLVQTNRGASGTSTPETCVTLP